MSIKKLLLATSVVAMSAGGAHAQGGLDFTMGDTNNACFDGFLGQNVCGSNDPIGSSVGDGQEMIVEFANEGVNDVATGEFEFYVDRPGVNNIPFPSQTNLTAIVTLNHAEMSWDTANLDDEDVVSHVLLGYVDGQALLTDGVAPEQHWQFSFESNNTGNPESNTSVGFRLPITFDVADVCNFKNDQEFTVDVEIAEWNGGNPKSFGKTTGVIARCKDGVFANGPFLPDNDGALKPGVPEMISDSTVALPDYLGFYPPLISAAQSTYSESGTWLRPPSAEKTIVGRVLYELCETAVLVMARGKKDNEYLNLEESVNSVAFGVDFFEDPTRMGLLTAHLLDGSEPVINHEEICKHKDGLDFGSIPDQEVHFLCTSGDGLEELFDETPDKIVIKTTGEAEIKHQNLRVNFAKATFHDARIDPPFEEDEVLCGVGPLDKLDREGRQFGFFDWNAVDSFNMNVYRVSGLAERDVDVHLEYENVRIADGLGGGKPGFDKISGGGKFTITADKIINGNAMIMVPGPEVDSVLPAGYTIADIQFRFKDTSPHIDVDRLQFNKRGGQLNTYGDGANNALSEKSKNNRHMRYDGPSGDGMGFVADGSGWWDQGDQPTNDGDMDLGTE